MPRKAGQGAQDPLKLMKIPEDFPRRAVQGVLRRAQRDGWSRSEIQYALEALGLAETAALGSAPSGSGKNGSTAVSGAVSGPPASSEERWCARKLHRMLGGNVYTDPQGHTRCRKCKLANRSTREPTPDPQAPGVAPAPAPKPEPPAPKPKPVASAAKPVVPAPKPKPVASAPKPVVPELKPKPAASAPKPKTPVKERAGDRQRCKRKLHLLIGENLLTDKRGKRECRQCRLWRGRRNRARKSGREFDEELT